MADEFDNVLGDEETETPIVPLDIPEEVEEGLDGDEVDDDEDDVAKAGDDDDEDDEVM